MALEYIPEPDKLLTCPYDESHSIRAIRFPKHLVKCRRNRQIKLVMCPFNANHMVTEEERTTHIAQCVDKYIVQQQSNSMTKRRLHGNLAVPPYENSVPPSTERWDMDDGSCQLSYDPSEAMNRARFLNPSCLSALKPAEKKLFHKQLLHKYRLLTRSKVDNETVSDVAEELGTLRLPRERPTPAYMEQSPLSAASSLSSSMLKPKPTSERQSPDIDGLLSDFERPPSSVASSVTSSTFFGMGRGFKPIDTDGSSAINERPPSIASSCASSYLGMGRGFRPFDIDVGVSSANDRAPSVASSCASRSLRIGRGWRPSDIDETSSQNERSPSVASSYTTYVDLGRAQQQPSVEDRYYTPSRQRQSLSEARPPSVSLISSSFWSVGRGRQSCDQSTDGSIFEDARSDVSYSLPSRGRDISIGSTSESLCAKYREKCESDRESVSSVSTVGAAIDDREEEVRIAKLFDRLDIKTKTNDNLTK